MRKKISAVWSFFSSVQLAIVLLALIAFFALIGTLVPQMEASGELSMSMSPLLFSFLRKIQIFDLYHSIWFFLLMGLLSFNLIICSLDRFPLTWRRFFRQPDPQEVFKDLPAENQFEVMSDIKIVSDTAFALLQNKYRNVKCANDGGSVFLCAQKGSFSLFGVYIVHLSLLVLITGAVIGSVFGVEGYINITEGKTKNAIYLRSDNRIMPLPFSVRCDKFKIELYKNGAPKNFQSDLTFFKADQRVLSEKLRVNHPVEFEGFRFYQAGYGDAPDTRATLSLLRESDRRNVLIVEPGYSYELPGKEGSFQLLKVEHDLMNMGPAIKVAVRSEQKEVTFWVFQQIDKIKEMNPDIMNQFAVLNPGLFHPYVFSLLGLEERYYTVLQVTRDHGTPVVAGSAVLLICGLLLILFSYARWVWIRVDQKGAGVIINVAGYSYKNQAGLQKEMQHLTSELQESMEKNK